MVEHARWSWYLPKKVAWPCHISVKAPKILLSSSSSCILIVLSPYLPFYFSPLQLEHRPLCIPSLLTQFPPTVYPSEYHVHKHLYTYTFPWISRLLLHFLPIFCIKYKTKPNIFLYFFQYYFRLLKISICWTKHMERWFGR